MNDITQWIKDHTPPDAYVLTDPEYWAVYDFVEAHKDEWDEPFKEGMLKLLNGEMHRRM